MLNGPDAANVSLDELSVIKFKVQISSNKTFIFAKQTSELNKQKERTYILHLQSRRSFLMTELEDE